MNCKEIQSNLMELAAGEKVSALVSQHVQACNVCAVELNELRSTLSLLDEWQAPADVSPYFMTRLRACLREESAAPARASFAEAIFSGSLFSWMRKPVLAGSMALVLAVVGGVGMLRMNSGQNKPENPLHAGTAVSDLQNLDGNNDLFANFELLDEVDTHN